MNYFLGPLRSPPRLVAACALGSAAAPVVLVPWRLGFGRRLANCVVPLLLVLVPSCPVPVLSWSGGPGFKAFGGPRVGPGNAYVNTHALHIQHDMHFVPWCTCLFGCMCVCLSVYTCVFAYVCIYLCVWFVYIFVHMRPLSAPDVYRTVLCHGR